MRIPAPSLADLDAAPVGSRITFDSPYGYHYLKTDTGWRAANQDGWMGRQLGAVAFERISRWPDAFTLWTPAPVKVHSFGHSIGVGAIFHVWFCRECGDFDHYTDSAAAHDAGRQHTATHVRSEV